MWNLTNYTVLNDLTKVHSIAANTDPAIPTGETALAVDRLSKFNLGAVTSIYKRAASAAVNEVAGITLPTTLAAGLYRLDITFELSSLDNRGDYARFMQYKGRPFSVEFNLNSSTTTATGLTSVIASMNKYIKRQEIVDAVVTLDATVPASPVLVITAGDEYIRLKTLKIKLYNTTTLVFDEYLVGSTTTSGAESFGTYDYMNRYISMPTDTKLNFVALRKDQLPIYGATYNQYTFNCTKQVTVPNGITAGVYSSVSYSCIVFVNAANATAFEAMITTSLPGKMTTV